MSCLFRSAAPSLSVTVNSKRGPELQTRDIRGIETKGFLSGGPRARGSRACTRTPESLSLSIVRSRAFTRLWRSCHTRVSSDLNPVEVYIGAYQVVVEVPALSFGDRDGYRVGVLVLGTPYVPLFGHM